MSINRKSRAMLFPKVGKFIIIFFAVALLIAGIWGYRLYILPSRKMYKTIIYLSFLKMQLTSR